MQGIKPISSLKRKVPSISIGLRDSLSSANQQGKLGCSVQDDAKPHLQHCPLMSLIFEIVKTQF
jgi:hypothetical protein